jgi:hypothetical protein
MINRGGIRRDVVLIGASAGGINPLFSILRRLPADLPAVVAFVLHRSPTFESQLCPLIARQALLPVMEPADGDPVKPGHIYVAPRDMHMLVERERWRLVRGPKVHWTRPAWIRSSHPERASTDIAYRAYCYPGLELTASAGSSGSRRPGESASSKTRARPNSRRCR